MPTISDVILKISSAEQMLMQEIMMDNDGKEAVELIKQFLKRIEKQERQAIKKPS